MYNMNQNIKLSNFGRRRGSKDKKKRVRYNNGILTVGKYQIGNKQKLRNEQLKRGVKIGAGVAGVGALGVGALMALKNRKGIGQVAKAVQGKLSGTRIAGLLKGGKERLRNSVVNKDVSRVINTPGSRQKLLPSSSSSSSRKAQEAYAKELRRNRAKLKQTDAAIGTKGNSVIVPSTAKQRRTQELKDMYNRGRARMQERQNLRKG